MRAPGLLSCRFFFCCILIAFIAGPATANDTVTVFGKVVRIMDGDTFEVMLTGNVTEKIRLHGIDCPERNQPFSNAAKQKLSELIFSQTVSFVRMDVDRFGRTVAMVYAGSTNVNEALLRAGLAWHFKRYDNNPQWAELERVAAAGRVGLWSDAHPVAPWIWRKM